MGILLVMTDTHTPTHPLSGKFSTCQQVRRNLCYESGHMSQQSGEHVWHLPQRALVKAAVMKCIMQSTHSVKLHLVLVFQKGWKEGANTEEHYFPTDLVTKHWSRDASKPPTSYTRPGQLKLALCRGGHCTNLEIDAGIEPNHMYVKMETLSVLMGACKYHTPILCFF